MDASSLDQILRKVIVVPLIALVGAAGILAWQIHAANVTVAHIEQDDERIEQTLRIEQLVIDQETGLRGFEITHDPRLLQVYIDAQKALPKAFAERRAMVTTSSRRGLLNTLESTHDTWEQGFASPLISTIQAGGNTNDDALNYRGKLMMDDMRRQIAALNTVTQTVRDRYIQQWHSQVRTVIIALLLVSAILGLVIGFYIRRLIQQISIAFRQSHTILRLRAEEAFRSEEKLRTTLKSIADGVIACDAEGRIQSLNDTAQELTGWTESEARDRQLDEVFPIVDETSRQPLENPVSRITSSNQIVRLQNHTILERRDGSEIFIEDSGSPIRDKHGRLVGAVLVFRDVTLARRSQEALLANEKLAVAGRLAASIAHEIHNPLDSVSNLLFLMDGVATNEERDHFLQLAKQEIARVTQISRAMLSLYRESKAPVLIDLREMLDSILLLMQSRFVALGVNVVQDVPGGLCVHGFPAELRQVFTNLLTNAAEADAGGGTVTLSAEAWPAGLDERGVRHEAGVLVTIEDNGPGIPDNILQNLFQPFFTTKGERGTGLGLWISRGIITKHGGTIQLSSSTAPEHHGTSVSIFLAVDPIMNASPS